MTATKVKPTETIGDNLPILTFQIKRIMNNCQYQVDIKNEWVQWVTEDVSRTSLKSITQAQAVKIICKQTGQELKASSQKPIANSENWGYFDHTNGQHKYIMSLLRVANIVAKHPKYGEVADMDGWFSRFLQSNRCPVKKPLKTMSTKEVSRIIIALEGVAVWKNTI